MRYLVVLMLAASLSGCWFVYIPSGMLSSSAQGNTCIKKGFFTGDKIKHWETGKVGTVTAVYGTSSRCAVNSHPVLADVAYE